MDTAKEYDLDVIQPSVRLVVAVFAFSFLHYCIPSISVGINPTIKMSTMRDIVVLICFK